MVQTKRYASSKESCRYSRHDSRGSKASKQSGSPERDLGLSSLGPMDKQGLEYGLFGQTIDQRADGEATPIFFP